MTDELLARTITGRASDEERSQVLEWRNLAPQNEERYQKTARLLALASKVDAERRAGPAPTAAEILSLADQWNHTGHSARETRSAFRARFINWQTTALSAAAIILLALGLSTFVESDTADGDFGAHQFVTGPSQQATVVLTDGSVIRLGADSRLMVPGDASGREVTLVGRGYFSVTRDESRPFTVTTASGKVRVLGTRFALDATNEDLSLVVVQGSVALAGANGEDEVTVKDKQMARVVNGTRLPVVVVPDPDIAARWVGNFLAFQNTPMRVAAQEIEREYGVSIVFADTAVAERTITAWFADWELEDVIDVVCTVAKANCEVGESRIVIESAAPTSQ